MQAKEQLKKTAGFHREPLVGLVLAVVLAVLATIGADRQFSNFQNKLTERLVELNEQEESYTTEREILTRNYPSQLQFLVMRFTTLRTDVRDRLVTYLAKLGPYEWQLLRTLHTHIDADLVAALALLPPTTRERVVKLSRVPPATRQYAEPFPGARRAPPAETGHH